MWRTSQDHGSNVILSCARIMVVDSLIWSNKGRISGTIGWAPGQCVPRVAVELQRAQPQFKVACRSVGVLANATHAAAEGFLFPGGVCRAVTIKDAPGAPRGWAAPSDGLSHSAARMAAARCTDLTCLRHSLAASLPLDCQVRNAIVFLNPSRNGVGFQPSSRCAFSLWGRACHCRKYNPPLAISGGRRVNRATYSLIQAIPRTTGSGIVGKGRIHCMCLSPLLSAPGDRAGRGHRPCSSSQASIRSATPRQPGSSIIWCAMPGKITAWVP